MHEPDDRSKKILWAIIESYIAYNGPVGSHTVMKRYPLGLSSATIRNTMADLEELGYVTQPHTSAGRIPTQRGYRLYVNSLLKRRALSLNKRLLQQVARLRFIEKDASRLIREASKTLSTFSHYLGIATSPKTDEIILKRIEFIKYRENKVLSVLISEEGIIKNRIIQLEEILTQKQLDKITRYLNNELSGLPFGEIKAKISAQISREKAICNKQLAYALRLCKEVITWEAENMFYTGEISGASNLPDFATMQQIKELFKAIEDKHLMLKLLNKMTKSEGVQVFIGSENLLSEMKELSMVVSTYTDGRSILGTISVIGPTKMNYEKVIPIVGFTAKTLTQILSEK